MQSFEIERARKVADYFGVKLEIVDFDYHRRGPELTDEFKDFFKAQMATSMSLYQWLDLGKYVAKIIKKKAVFCGEISDGAHNFGFAQMITDLFHPRSFVYKNMQTKWRLIWLVNFLKSVWDGSFVKDSVYELIKNKSVGKYEEPGPSQFDRTKPILASQFTRDVRTPLWALENQRFVNEEGLKLYRNEIEDCYLDEVALQISNDPTKIYSGLIHLYNSFHWNGGTVQTVQMTEELFGIKINLPFRDTRITDF